jgi:hypothetical protein
MSENCQFAGCIGHTVVTFECHEKGIVTNPMVKFQARVHYRTASVMLDHAGKEMVRKLQSKYGRKEGFPTDRIVDVDENCQFEKTLADRKADFDKLTPEQQAATIKELQALLNAIGGKSK